MAKARRLASACDLFYSRGRAVSWFLQAVKPLKMRPAAFLGRFASAAEEDGLFGRDLASPLIASSRIEVVQLAFLESEYRAKGLDSLVPALRDIVTFNGAWGRATAFARTARPRPGRYLLAAGPEGPELQPVRKPGRKPCR
jgi:hypothetical protein